MERISADAGTQFTSTEFKEGCQTRGVRLTLAAPEHQEMNGQVEVTWRTLRTIAHAFMVYARVPVFHQQDPRASRMTPISKIFVDC